MRILFLNPAAELGGAERSLLDLIASIRAYAPSTEIGVLVAADGPLVREAGLLGARVIPLPFGRRLSRVGDSAAVGRGARSLLAVAQRTLSGTAEVSKYAWRLRAAIRDFAPSVVHSNGIKMHVLSAAARGRAPLVWHVRDFIASRPVASAAMTVCSPRVDAVIAISNAVARDARKALPSLNPVVVHNAIDTDAFSPGSEAADLDALAGAAPAPPHALRIGLVATYARWKGHDVFLEAARLARSRREGSALAFYVVGGPIYGTVASQFSADELRALSRHLGLEEAVRFVPFQHTLAPVYRALDVVVHASTRPEPFGRTIVEAMSTGRAVIATREGGAGEILSNGSDAVGIPCGSAPALAHAIVDLADNPKRRRLLGEAARATAVARFSRRRLAEQVLAVYRRIGAP